jgi:hypothetical protein
LASDAVGMLVDEGVGIVEGVEGEGEGEGEGEREADATDVGEVMTFPGLIFRRGGFPFEVGISFLRSSSSMYESNLPPMDDEDDGVCCNGEISPLPCGAEEGMKVAEEEEEMGVAKTLEVIGVKEEVGEEIGGLAAEEGMGMEERTLEMEVGVVGAKVFF